MATNSLNPCTHTRHLCNPPSGLLNVPLISHHQQHSFPVSPIVRCVVPPRGWPHWCSAHLNSLLLAAYVPMCCTTPHTAPGHCTIMHLSTTAVPSLAVPSFSPMLCCAVLCGLTGLCTRLPRAVKPGGLDPSDASVQVHAATAVVHALRAHLHHHDRDTGSVLLS